MWGTAAAGFLPIGRRRLFPVDIPRYKNLRREPGSRPRLFSCRPFLLIPEHIQGRGGTQDLNVFIRAQSLQFPISGYEVVRLSVHSYCQNDIIFRGTANTRTACKLSERLIGEARTVAA